MEANDVTVWLDSGKKATSRKAACKPPSAPAFTAANPFHGDIAALDSSRTIDPGEAASTNGIAVRRFTYSLKVRAQAPSGSEHLCDSIPLTNSADEGPAQNIGDKVPACDRRVFLLQGVKPSTGFMGTIAMIRRSAQSDTSTALVWAMTKSTLISWHPLGTHSDEPETRHGVPSSGQIASVFAATASAKA
eukprot:CAMPEP_0172796188 /NCGR_PEP_ID=MMETSP1074-20121228/210862_1 /TAXON_ID=2916 /ORGANISM="Ceratium fusus, Strain PA161109" /LENGTH=189 /DNA_ID=CAMNT_0013633279 /DNA_START=671 /DNA_END=1241 /DNA_ORIENTATION=-